MNDNTIEIIENSEESQIEKTENNENRYTFIEKILKRGYLIIIIFTTLLYSQTLFFEIVNLDDFLIIEEIKGWDGIFTKIENSFTMQYIGGAYFRPLVSLSLGLDTMLSGNGYFFFHLSNLIMHLISCCLIFYVLKKIGFSKFISFLSAMIFSCHPLFVNALAWIPGRNDLLLGLFTLLSFAIFLNSINNKKWFYFFHSLAFFLALLSKETALMLPILCALYYIFIAKEKLISLNFLYLIISWVIPIILWYYLRSIVLKNVEGNIIGFEYFLSNMPTLPEFISKFYTTINISVLPIFKTISGIIGIGVFVALVILTVILKESRKMLVVFGIIWFLFYSVPGMFSLVFTDRDFFDYFECRAYLPSFGLLIILVELLPKEINRYRNKYFLVGFTALLIFLSSYSIVLSNKYSTPLKFWKSAVKDAPKRARTQFELGVNYGRFNQFDKAEKRIITATILNPKRPEFHYELGKLYYKEKKYDKSIGSLLNALDIYPNWQVPKNDLARVLYITGRYGESLFVLKDLLYSSPNNPKIIKNIINTFLAANQLDSAISYSQKLTNITGERVSLAHYLNILAVEAAKNKDYITAESRWLLALKLDTNLLESYTNLYYFYYNVSKDYPKALNIAENLVNRGQKVNKEEIDFLKRQLKNQNNVKNEESK